MNKYAFDIDDDDDDEVYGAKVATKGTKGKGSSGPPPPASRSGPTASTKSTKAPAPVRYSSSVDLMNASNPLSPNSFDTLSVKKAFADRDLVSHEENLGFSFYSTPWVPPDIDKAAIHRMSNVYKEGRAPIDQCKLTEDLSLGIGLNMYFQWAISIAAGFFAISILALPTLVIAYSGQAVGPQDQDIMGLYALTLANIGHDPNSLTYAADSACTQESGITSTVNQTCVTVNGSEYTLESVSLAITVVELLQILAFFLMIWHLQRRFNKIKFAQADSGVPSITDYAVHVTNIPADTTLEELVQHFSDLYQLEATDFRGRLPVEDAGPVDSTGYGNSEVYVGTWVAQCTICTKMGKVVRYLEQRKELMKKLYASRARMKMYGPKSPNRGGFNKKLYAQEEKVMLQLAAQVDKLNEKIHMNYVPPADGDVEKGSNTGGDGDESANSRPPSRPGTASKSKKGAKKGTKGGAGAHSKGPFDDADDDSTPFPAPNKKKQKSDADLSLGGGNGNGDSNKSGGGDLARGKSFKERINGLLRDEPVLAAFVCFEYNESFARCIEDHKFWSRFPLRLCAPKQMLFKGRLLHVTRAPEPDQIVWENIEVGKGAKVLARLRTLGLIAAVLIVLYGLCAAAADAKVKYDAFVPPVGLCHRALPELYAGSQASNDSYLALLQLARPSNADREALDAQCAGVLPDSYYLLYTRNGDLGAPAVDYSLSNCNVTAAQIDQLCPANGQATYCPCQSHNAGGECASLGCQDGDKDRCIQFSTADTLNCYCNAQIVSMISSGSVASVLSWFFTYLQTGSYPDSSDECVDTKYYLGASVFALYLSIIATLIANHVLSGIVLRNAKAEHHVSFDQLHRAIASSVFLATYLNLSIMLLLAYGYSTETPPLLSDNYIFSGPFQDFDRSWYRTVALYLVVTFLLMTFPPFLSKYFNYFVLNRFQKFYAYKEVVDIAGKNYPTQYSLNQLEVDETSFDMRVRCGQMLAWVFAAMTYGAGVPILLPLCAAALFFLFRMDKFFLCRFYKQPAVSGPGLMQWVLRVLPYAAVVRLAFSIFILSADGLLPDTWPSVQGADQSAGGYSASVISLDSYISAVTWLQNSDYVPTTSAWLSRRILRVNTFPLFVILLVILLAKLLRKVWAYLPPVILARYLWIPVKLVLGYNRFRASKPGYVHPYDLTFHHPDPLRNQEASLSGGYMKYLRHKDDKPFTWYNCCCFFWKFCYPQKESLPELGFRWEILEDGDFDVKIKTWPATMQLTEGSIKMTGDQKYTYDLICEQNCNSFNLESIPAYRTVGLMLRKEPFVPIVPAYQEWRAAFEKENGILNAPPAAAHKRPKFTLGDEEKKDSDDEGPATTEDKSKNGGLLKKKGALAGKNGNNNKVVPVAVDPEEKDEAPPGKKGLKKAVSFQGGKPAVEVKKPPAPVPGKKKSKRKQQPESSSSSSSRSSSSWSSSSDSSSSSSSSGSGSGSSSGSSSSSGSDN